MTRRLISPALALFLGAALASTAAAQTPPAPVGGGGAPAAGMPGLPRTAEEVQPWAQRLLTRFDANQDGALTEDEVAVPGEPDNDARGGGPRMQAMIMRADADGDARVTLAELTAGVQVMFERMNRTGAGGGGGGGVGGMMRLPRTADEVQPWAEGLVGRLDTDQNGALTGSELAVLANPQVAAMGGSRLRAMIVQSDANRDSRITAEEVAVGGRRMFDRMDVNGDGRLDDSELPQSPARPAPLAMPPADDPAPFPDMSDGD